MPVIGLPLFYNSPPSFVYMLFLSLPTGYINAFKHWEYRVVYVDFAQDLETESCGFFGKRP